MTMISIKIAAKGTSCGKCRFLVGVYVSEVRPYCEWFKCYTGKMQGSTAARCPKCLQSEVAEK